MTKLTDARIQEIWHTHLKEWPEIRKTLINPVVFARAIEAELQPDICDKNCTWRDHHPDCERAEPVAWTYSWDDGEKTVSLIKASADEWNPTEPPTVTPLYTAPPDQTAEIERLKLYNIQLECAVTNLRERVVTLEAALREAKVALRCADDYDHGPKTTDVIKSALDMINKALGEKNE